MFLYIVDLLGTAIFAISGVSLAFRSRMDAIGVFVLAGVVAIGGGTIRDIILDVPVFWLSDNNYVWIVLAVCMTMMIFTEKPSKIPSWILPVSDAVGLAFFAIMGAEKALQHGATPTVAVLMGTLTGCGGGVIRDILARRVPFILREEIYATACIIGITFYCVLDYLQISANLNIILGISTVLMIRLAAIKWNLSLPTFYYHPKPSSDKTDKR